MISDLLSDPNTGKYAVLFTILFFGGIETFAGHIKNSNRTRDDWMNEFGGFLLVSFASFVGLFGIICSRT